MLSVAHVVTAAPPVWRPALVGLALALGAYNFWLRGLRRMPARTARLAMALAVAADFVVVGATELATLDQPHLVHWPAFMIIALEAAVMFGWKGTCGFLMAFLPCFLGSAALADRWFGVRPEIQDVKNGIELVVVMALLAGATAAVSWRRQASAEAARAEVQARVDRLSALNQITHGIGSQLHENTVLEVVLGPLHQLYPQQWHGVLFDDAAGGGYLARGEEDLHDLRTRWLAALGPIEQGVLVIDDLLGFMPGSVPGGGLPDEWERFRAALIVPLKVQGRRLGWLVALDKAPGAFDASDAGLFEAVGLQLALAVDNARVHQEAERLAVTDALTGLANRRAVQARVTERDTPVAVIEIDLDGFKEINDVYGHHVGDAVLVETARRIERATRADDLVARLGGDEFLVYLHRSLSRDEAHALATRIAHLIEQPMDVDGRSVSVGASVGTAVGVSSDNQDELLRRADDEMYVDKRARAHQAAAVRPVTP